MVQHFREDCGNLFCHRAHQFGDQVFLATISDVELLGLAEYARHEPTSRLATWHCQFHFNIFEGRPQEYACQSAALHDCRERFRQAIDSLRDHRVHFYNTSDELADQYQRMGLAEFHSLAYPVNPRLSIARTPRRIQSKHPHSHSATVGSESEPPLRITLAGAVRREKGQAELDQLVRRIGPSLLQSRSATMVIQRKRRSRFRRQQVDLTDALRQAGVDATQCVEYVDHPLDNGAYENLMQQADVGLFLYDGRTYYARRAGVLGEFLSLGVPVIVPAGCWLSQQIRDINEQYHDKIIEQPFAQTCSLSDALQHESPVSISRQEPIIAQVTLPPGCQQLLIRARVLPEAGESNFLSCQLRPSLSTMGSAERCASAVDQNVQILAASPSTGACLPTSFAGASSSTQIALPSANVSEVALELQPAFTASRVQIEDLQVVAVCQTNVPLGVVGLAALSRDHVPALLEELHRHYSHYRSTAVDFANQWYAAHDPKEVIRQLLQKSHQQRRAA